MRCRHKMTWRIALASIAIAALVSTVITSNAQTLDRGEINGTIRDESGAVLPGVAVTLRDTKTGFERNTVSAAAGQYSGLLLPLGVYVVRAELSGFSVAKSDPLPLTVGQALVVNLVMKVASITETVEVSAPPGNTAPALGTVIDDKAIVSLPINGRDYRDFALLSPTARSITGTRGTLRVAGQPGDYLALNVDGADFTNNFFGEFFGSLETKNFTIPLEAVQEFEVSAGGLGAQSGRSNGGLVNVVTKSGSNEKHGSLAYFLRHHDLTANNRLSVRTIFTRNQGDNTAGGSLILSRATSNLELFHNQGMSTVASMSSSLGPGLFLESKFQVSGETRPRERQATTPQVQISDTGTFGGSASLPRTQDMYRYQASENIGYLHGKHTFKIGVDYDGFNMRNNSFALALNGAYTFPTLAAFIQRQPSLYSQNFGLNGHTAQDAALLRSFWQHEVAAYMQDQFRPTSRLTINVGLRYDAQVNPQPQAGTAGVKVPVGLPGTVGNQVQLTYAPVPQGIPHDTNAWGPRGDFAYDLTGVGSTMLKSSAGFYSGRTPMIYFPLRGSGVSNTTLVAAPSQFGVTFPNILPSAIVPGSTLAGLLGPPAIQYVDPDFRNPRVLQVSASVTRSLIAGLSLEAGYMFSDSRNLRIGGYRSTVWDRNLASPSQFDQFGRGINILAAGRPDT